MPYIKGAASAAYDELFRWMPHSRHVLVTGSTRYNRSLRLMLTEMRRRAPPPEHGLRITAMVLTAILHLMALFVGISVQPPPYGSPNGTGAQGTVAAVSVRLINAPQSPAPPPAVPPQPAPTQVAHAPAPVARKPPQTRAMPAIPKLTVTPPKITVTPTKPQVSAPPPMPVPVTPHVVATRPIQAPKITVTPPALQVVTEPSSHALPVPKIKPVQAAPVQATETPLAPIPLPATQAPQVAPAQAQIEVSAQPTVQPVPQAPQRVVASLPEVPTTPPSVPTVTMQPAQPTVSTKMTPVQQVTQAPVQATLAPIPREQMQPTVTQLQPSQPEAVQPQLSATPVQSVPVTPVTATAPPVASKATAPQPAASVVKTPAPTKSPGSSWVPANDQFKPAQQAGNASQQASTQQPTKQQGTVVLAPRGNSDVMTRNADHLGYKPTIFSKYWQPLNESILDTFLRHLIEKLTVTHTFTVAPGVRIHCALGPMAVFLACGGDAPRPGSKKSNDRRLNMAPARPLVPNLGQHAPASATSAPIQLNSKVQCAVARVAGGPPPPGCPKAPPPPGQSDQWR